MGESGVNGESYVSPAPKGYRVIHARLSIYVMRDEVLPVKKNRPRYSPVEPRNKEQTRTYLIKNFDL